MLRLVVGFRGARQFKNTFKKGSYVLRNVRNHPLNDRAPLPEDVNAQEVYKRTDGRTAHQPDSKTRMVNPNRQVLQNSQRVTKAQTKPVSNPNLPRNQP